MIDVNEIFTTVKSIVDKVSGSFKPNEFNKYAELASKDLFSFYYGSPKQYNERGVSRAGYASTQNISEKLSHLIIQDQQLTLTSGRGNTPSDKAHIISITCNTAPRVDRVEGSVFEMRKRSSTFPATAEYPVYRETATQLEFAPATLEGVAISYLRYPAIPKWGYDLVSSRPVYSASKSTNFDFPESEKLNLISRILKYMGIQNKDMPVLQFANQEAVVSS